MAQEFHVLRCYSCESFQVQQEFGRGTGADCRRHVQKLNTMRGAMMEEQEHNTCSSWKQVEAQRAGVPEEDYQIKGTGLSRWHKYLDTPAEPEEEEEDDVSLDRDMRKRGRIKGGRLDGCTPEQANSSSLEHGSPPRKRSVNALSESPAPVFTSDSQWEESVSDDIICLPLTRSLLPVSSMFESGDDFSIEGF
ncbi:MRN complex-interacting protein isoform 2-T2 [Spinachia spinachia]